MVFMTDTLLYGNPSREVVDSLANSVLLKKWNSMGRLDMLKEMPYPDEEMTKKELWHMVDLSKDIPSSRIKYLKEVDKNLFGVMSEFLRYHGIDEPKEKIKTNLQVYEPLIDYLKMGYNRPRPHQAAGHYGIPLYPILESKTAATASYPSGHTLYALWFRRMYKDLYPHLANDLMKFVLEVKLTREEGGVHYPSDGHFSFKVYKHLKDYM